MQAGGAEAELLDTAGGELRQVIGKIRTTSAAQLRAIEAVSSDVEGVRASVGEIAAGVQAVLDAANEGTEKTQACAGQVLATTDKMRTLEESFRSVNRLLRDVNTIADQTRLLALNATIEAARAGEVGRGFAVVAGEVKQLSQTTRAASAEIDAILAGVRGSIEDVSRALGGTYASMNVALDAVRASLGSARSVTGTAGALEGAMRAAAGSVDGLGGTVRRVEEDLEEVAVIGGTFENLLAYIRLAAQSEAGEDPLAPYEALARESGFYAPERFAPGRRENHVSAEDVLISRTDLRGVITYANRTFYRLAEFPPGALVGKPHSVIRHPDMPRSAFADLWRTIQAGKVWQGYVMNRARSGALYWVKALVFPCVASGQPTGYISVRHRAEPAAVARAIEIYRRLP